MKPLQAVAMGLVIVALHATRAGYDLLPDPLGWLLVWYGVRRLRLSDERPAEGRAVVWLAALAGVVSAVLWLPATQHALTGAQPSLLWTLALPQLLFTWLLCRVLWTLATEGQVDDPVQAGPAATWRLLATAAIVVALLPVAVFGAGIAALEPLTYVGADLLLVVVIVMGFTHSGRAWAQPVTDPAAGPATTGVEPGDADGAAR